MAKGNMLQGMARGKVGDVVFSRLHGEQISRVRNRHPKNPRSNAQLYQRAIMATVMQAYSAGKVIFDHAFEGYAVGAANQRRFMQLNAKLLRSQVAADINNNVAVASQVGRVVAPGLAMPVPALLTASRGSYQQSAFNFVAADANNDAKWSLLSKTGGETLGKYASRLGLIAGDVYTLCGFIVAKDTNLYETPGVTDKYGIVRNCEFGYIRMTVKDSVTDSEATTFGFGDIFDIESSSNIAPFNYTEVNQALTIASLTPVAVGNIENINGVITMIRSRKDEDLRSNSDFVVGRIKNVATTDGLKYGIASDYLLTAWNAGTEALGDSDLILEGGEFNGRPAVDGSGD